MHSRAENILKDWNFQKPMCLWEFSLPIFVSTNLLDYLHGDESRMQNKHQRTGQGGWPKDSFSIIKIFHLRLSTFLSTLSMRLSTILQTEKKSSSKSTGYMCAQGYKLPNTYSENMKEKICPQDFQKNPCGSTQTGQCYASTYNSKGIFEIHICTKVAELIF